MKNISLNQSPSFQTLTLSLVRLRFNVTDFRNNKKIVILKLNERFGLKDRLNVLFSKIFMRKGNETTKKVGGNEKIQI